MSTALRVLGVAAAVVLVVATAAVMMSVTAAADAGTANESIIGETMGEYGVDVSDVEFDEEGLESADVARIEAAVSELTAEERAAVEGRLAGVEEPDAGDVLTATAAVTDGDAGGSDASDAGAEGTPDGVLYQFATGAELTDVSFEERDGSGYMTYVTLKGGDERSEAFIAEPIEDAGTFEFRSFVLPAGEERTLAVPVSDKEIGVAVGDEGIVVDDKGVTVLESAPDVGLVQLAAVSGVIGTVIALLIVTLWLRRQHHNSYEELFSEKRIRLEEDPVETSKAWVVKQLKVTKESRYRIGAVALLAVYAGLVAFGVVRSPGEIWGDASDAQRLWTAAVTAATMSAVTPVYLVVKRYLWNPDKEFIFDLDSKDVYRAADGDKSGDIAAYAGPPDRINELAVDGALTTISTPGGRCHLVRGFDPETNEASGNPPECADDLQVSIQADKIEANRGVLTELALVGRDLIASMSTFRVTADANAVRDIDSHIRHSLSAVDDSFEDVLQDALQGTRYEGTYQPAESNSNGGEDGESGDEPGGEDGESDTGQESLSTDAADGESGGSQ